MYRKAIPVICKFGINFGIYLLAVISQEPGYLITLRKSPLS